MNVKSIYRYFFREKSFIRNASVTSFWNFGIIGIQFFLSPIITRIFDPSQYGVFSIYNSIVINLSVINTLRYAQAIILPKEEIDKDNLVSFSILFSISFFLLLYAITPFSDELLTFFKLQQIGYFIYFVPLGILLVSFIEIIVSINVREKLFKRNSIAGFINQALSRTANISYGIFIKPETGGLILGDLFGKLVCLIILFSKNLGKYLFRCLSVFRYDDIKTTIIKYKDFPLYNLPSSLISTLSGHIPIYFLQLKFGLSIVGSFSLASGLLEVLNRALPYSIAPVYMQRMSELKQKGGSIELYLPEIAGRTFKLLLILTGISFAGFTVVSLTAERVFEFWFGEGWSVAGKLCSVLSVYYFSYFINIPIGEVFAIVGKQHVKFWISNFNFCARILTVVGLMMTNFDAAHTLLIYAFVCATGNIMNIFVVFRILRHSSIKAAALVTSGTILITYFVLVNLGLI